MLKCDLHSLSQVPVNLKASYLFFPFPTPPTLLCAFQQIHKGHKGCAGQLILSSNLVLRCSYSPEVLVAIRAKVRGAWYHTEDDYWLGLGMGAKVRGISKTEMSKSCQGNGKNQKPCTLMIGM